MIVIGTRGSQLALWQADYVRTCLERHHLGLDFQIKVIKTTGDKLQKNRLDDGVSKGAFTKEIDQAQFDGAIDLAVHSLKDLPVKLPVGISLGAVPTRNDPRDMLVSKIGTSLSHLPPNAKVGTHSLRRQTQLRYQRPDLEIVGIRGNIDTRIQKLRDTDLNAIILATAGLNRLYSSSHNKSPSLPGLQLTPIPTELMVPAAGQGALAITVRTGDKNMIDLVKNINHTQSQIEITAERSALHTLIEVSGLEAGCQIPVGIHAQHFDDKLRIKGVLFSDRGIKQTEIEGSIRKPTDLGQKIGHQLSGINPADD